MVPVLIIWMQVSREFEISLIAPREFNIVKYYLQTSVGMRFSDSEQRIWKKKTKRSKVEGDMERRRKIDKNERDHVVQRTEI